MGLIIIEDHLGHAFTTLSCQEPPLDQARIVCKNLDTMQEMNTHALANTEQEKKTQFNS